MICGVCKKDLEACNCSDKEERINKIISSPYIAYRKCTVCGKHYALCFCTEPKWVVACGGE